MIMVSQGSDRETKIVLRKRGKGNGSRKLARMVNNRVRIDSNTARITGKQAPC